MNHMNETVDESVPDRWWTVPNALCLIRLIGSLTLVPAAIAGRPDVVLALFLLLALTDGMDGLIARWFHQRSRIGPKLDSLADVTMYSMLLFAVVWMRSDLLASELPWLAVAAGMFLFACLASLWKFGCCPAITRTVRKRRGS